LWRSFLRGFQQRVAAALQAAAACGVFPKETSRIPRQSNRREGLFFVKTPRSQVCGCVREMAYGIP
jgi:hypothetical protein